MDQGYERAGLAMAPLGLEVDRAALGQDRDARPGHPPDRAEDPRRAGAERRAPWPAVSVRLGSGEVRTTSEVTVGEPCREFRVESRKVEVSSGPAGIVVFRKGGDQADWLCDLWLAERLAEG